MPYVLRRCYECARHGKIGCPEKGKGQPDSIATICWAFTLKDDDDE